MNLQSLITESDVTDFSFHDELNPKIWDGFEMKSKIQTALLKIASVFVKSLDIGDVEIEDIILTGSNVNFNYSEKYSDLDLHIIFDFSKIDTNEDLVTELMIAKKSLWNEHHKITIKGIPVELYAQNIDKKERKGVGIFSVKNNTWIKKPVRGEETMDVEAAVEKAKVFMKLIDHSIKTCDSKCFESVKERIMNMRQAGLDEGGEFSVENLAFKILRRNGYLEKFFDSKIDVLDKELTVTEVVDMPPAIIHKVEHKLSQGERLVTAATLIGESGGEGEKGMHAVMNVINNRSKGNPKKFAEVCLKPHQFSMFNGATVSKNENIKDIVHKAMAHPRWKLALKLVDEATHGRLNDITGSATHYHTKKVSPYWSSNKNPIAIIGNHKFYKNV